MPNQKITVGTIISSEEFAFGYHGKASFRNDEIEIIVVDGVTTSYTPQISYTEEEKVAYYLVHGHFPKGHKTIQLGAPDTSRGKAKYVVEEVTLEDGLQGYPDRNNPIITVIARKLHPNGVYNVNGELIAFRYNDPGRSQTIKELKIEGQMQRIFI